MNTTKKTIEEQSYLSIICEYYYDSLEELRQLIKFTQEKLGTIIAISIWALIIALFV